MRPAAVGGRAGARPQFVTHALEGWGVADGFDDVPLITSELVTNAVRHAEGPVNVSIDLEAERVRVEVEDQSERLPVKAGIDLERDGGWGLHIVERCCSRWGLETHLGGKTVWCEVETRRPSDPPPQF